MSPPEASVLLVIAGQAASCRESILPPKSLEKGLYDLPAPLSDLI
jgi:hypothetical protein